MWTDPWTVLGIRPGAGLREARAAWRRQVSRWHPDRNPSAEATLRLQQVNDAWSSIERGAAVADTVATWQPTASVLPDEPVLAGISGTVLGQADGAAARGARDCVHVELEIPAASWTLDEPVTLGVPLPHDYAAIVTLPRPRRFDDGASIFFPRSGLDANGGLADLLITVRTRGGEPRARLGGASVLACPGIRSRD